MSILDGEKIADLPTAISGLQFSNAISGLIDWSAKIDPTPELFAGVEKARWRAVGAAYEEASAEANRIADYIQHSNDSKAASGGSI